MTLLPLALALAVSAAAAPSARELARAQDPLSAPLLLKVLEGGERALRPEAAWALGQIGLAEVPAGEPEPGALASARAAATPALVTAASSEDPALRRAAVEALGKLGGPDALPAVLRAGGDADAEVRGEAALALFRQRFLKRVPEYSTASALKLSALAADPEPEVRWRAVYAFSRWPEPRAAQALGLAARDSDWRARLFAARALGRLGSPPDAALLADPVPHVRAEAVAALSAAKAWELLPDSVFEDGSAHVRAAAADAAAASGDARFIPLLERVVGEPGTLAPGRALLALARLKGADAAPLLAQARKDPRWWLRARAYEASASLPGGDRILKEEGLADPDARVAAQALETLAASTSALALPALESALREPKAELELRGTAIDAAVERADPALLDALLEAARHARGPGAGELRGSIRKALAAIAKRSPAHAARVEKELKGFEDFLDKPRTFRKAPSSPPSVVFETERGSFTVALAPSGEAWNHVAALVESVKAGLYDGASWHRVVTGFVVQGGDPRGSGWGDAGWRLADEINRIRFERGTLGMPKAGKDTGGCQLFFSVVPTPHLDGRYTAYGQVLLGHDVLDRLEPGDKILKASLR